MFKASFKVQRSMALGFIIALVATFPSFKPVSVLALGEAAAPQGSIEKVRSLLLQARDLIDKKKLDAATPLLESAAQLDPNPNSASVHQNLGFLYQQKGDNNKALKQYELALHFHPGMPQATFNIAQCYLAMEKNAEAVNWYEKFLKESPESPYAGKVREVISSLKEAQVGEVANGDEARDYFATVTREGAYRWSPDQLPLKVYIADGSGVQGYSKSFNHLVSESLDSWVRASGSRIAWVQTDNPRSADIVCDWVTQFPKNSQNSVEAGNTDLYARPSADGSLMIHRAHVSILTLENGRPYTSQEIQRTCLHEIGHALGLKEHSPYSGDIMFFSDCASQADALSERDRSTIARLYQTYPVVTSRFEAGRNRS